MKPLENLFCRSAQNMSPYSPIEPPDQIAKRLGLKENQIIKLDANENPYGTAPDVLHALSNVKYYHIYPDPAQVQLREAIAAYAQCQPDQIIAGTGADEIIDIVCRLLLEPGEAVINFTPSFSYYSHIIALNRGNIKAYPRESDFTISLDKVKTINLTKVKLVILCSPNNPTGNLLEEPVLDYFLDQDLIVMLDEAYYEFSSQSYMDKLKNHNNLIILRTFSKCFALAGLRVGYGIASNELAQALMKIKPPFSVNIAAEAALKICLQNLPIYEKQVNQIIETRNWTQKKLSNFNQIDVFQSQSNFILCRIMDYNAKLLHKNLENKGILVRYFETPQLHEYIRISVGTREQMEVFLEELEKLVG